MLVVELDPLHKVTIKPSPNTSIHDILREACSRLNLSPVESYTLKYKKTNLDLTLPYRLSNLPPGANLDIIQVSLISKPVRVGFQIDESRYSDSFLSNCTIFDALVKIEKTNQINILSNQTESKYLMPVVVFMNREYASLDKLQSTTFREAGLVQGSGLFKITFKQDCEFDQVAQKIQEEISKSNAVSVVQPKKPVEITKEKPVQVEEKAELAPIVILHCDQFKTENPEMQESDFELNENQMRLFIAQQKQTEQPLMTKAMREKQVLEYRKKFPKTQIRIKFPDRFMAQFEFDSNATIKQLYAQVKLILDREMEFELFITPPKQALDPLKTFWDYNLVPAALIHVSCSSCEPQLAETYKRQVVAPITTQSTSTGTSASTSSTRTLPKWLKLSK